MLIHTINIACVRAKLLQSYLTLCDPMDCSPAGSSVHGILQARMLEWVATPFSRGSSDPGIKPGFHALQADVVPSEPRELAQYTPATH